MANENDYRNPNLTPVERKVRNLHYWGLIGLIPNFGFIAGIVLLVKAFKYKKRSLYLVSIACILYTPIFWVLVLPPLMDSGSQTHTQMKLIDVVKSIEFYKLQHGSYPDSLQQLLDDDKFVFLEDYSGNNIWKQTQLYNYSKIGDNYTVFSSGLDRIANTNDDIYPETKGGDSSKIGLIRRAQ